MLDLDDEDSQPSGAHGAAHGGAGAVHAPGGAAGGVDVDARCCDGVQATAGRDHKAGDGASSSDACGGGGDGDGGGGGGDGSGNGGT
jgi:hypothetical protein